MNISLKQKQITGTDSKLLVTEAGLGGGCRRGIFGCGMWDLYLGHLGPLIEACELLVVILNHLDLDFRCLTRDQT